MIPSYNQFKKLSFEERFPHEIKCEAYWRRILANSDYAIAVLDTVMKKQKGRASDRQMEVMKRAEGSITTPYSPRN